MDATTRNPLRAIRLDRPEHILGVFRINPACWHHRPVEALIEFTAAHPILFPQFDPKTFAIPEPAPWERSAGFCA